MNTETDIIKLTDLALVPPVLNTNPLPQYGYDKLDYSLTGGVERTRGGRLWTAWMAGGDNEKAFVVAATSDDAGATWSDPRLVIDPHDASMPLSRSAVGVVPWLDPKGRLWMFFSMSMNYFDGRMGVWAARCDHPDSEIPEWTMPTRIWHGFGLNKPIVLSTGEWLLPVSLWQREMISSSAVECVSDQDNCALFADSFHELDVYRMSNVLVSRDEGQTWERRGGASFPASRDFEEPVVIERGDGSLWMIARTIDEGMWQSISRDGGATWSVGEPWLAHVNSRHLLRRLPSGRLLMVKHGFPVETRPKTRSQLSAYLSDDDGATWRGGLIIDEREGVSYPDGAVSADGPIFVQYDRNRDTDGEVLLARFTEADVLAGQCVSAGSALRLLITRPAPATVAARHAERKKTVIRRLLGDSQTPFVHIPRWNAWNGVGDIETLKANMNNGSVQPGLNHLLPPETDPSGAHSWKELVPVGITNTASTETTLFSHDPTGGTESREGFVSFEVISPPREGKLGYVRSFIYSPSAQEAVFLLGADYWMQFRVNGELRLDHSREMRPGWSPDLYEFRCDVPLHAGWNLLEIKIASGYLGFAFACQVSDHGDLVFSMESDQPERLLAIK